MARIYYSFLLPKGYIQVISQAQGKFLISQLSTLPASAKIHIRFEVYKTIKVPRELSLVCIDSGKHNVFYDCATNAVTMVDFELMQPVEPELLPCCRGSGIWKDPEHLLLMVDSDWSSYFPRRKCRASANGYSLSFPALPPDPSYRQMYKRTCIWTLRAARRTEKNIE
ncbi:hypothetical protein An13g02200 [Aspergillus niger]|uniref:Uncharacterized protein n=2 Tax=Aspergillus niger TaxID=5061 RepID=A2R1R9_ASPNC|nr:hypothetical protein An13g02200 [Aspergillus niger]CAK41619.1 hypothetical protein An13g02200 [Aspergillus niger]